MLGVEYQSIYCKVEKCQHNDHHIVYNGDDEIVEEYNTCSKEEIHLDEAGKCKEDR